MKKFNAKKVIVLTAIGMFFIGGTVFAAKEWTRWQGENDTVLVQNDLDTLDRLLTAKEEKVKELNGEIATLNTKVSNLAEALGLVNASNQTLTQKLTTVQAALQKEEAITSETKGILSDIEHQVGLSDGTGKSATARVDEIKLIVIDYIDGLNQDIKNLKSDVSTLTGQKSALESEKTALQNQLTKSGTEKSELETELRHAVDDMSGLKVKSNGIVNKHLNK